MQVDDLLFDRALGDEAIDRHWACLTEAVGAIRSLVFDGRIPPRVHMHHVVGCRQVQAKSARLQADQEDITLARLKCLNAFFSFLGWCAAIEILVGDAFVIERLSEDRQMVHELAEHQYLVAIVEQFFERL